MYVRHYGPGNFLWFSDVALFLGLAAIWLEHRLLASTQALAVVVPESLWIIEFLVRLTTGVHPSCSSSWSLGSATIIAPLACRLCSALFMSYALTAPEDNVNWVHSRGRVRGLRPLAFSAIAFPLGFYLPVHLVLRTHVRRDDGELSWCSEVFH